MDLTDKRVVVIGGSSGIGFAVAEAALAQGAEVIIGSSQAANVEAATARLGARATGHAVNVREEPSVEAFFEAVGGFDHLVFTAGD
jgi:NAD(P)-dependent dehydrogenase (short-subunit alcohol dehydrogenase family)